MNDGGTALLLMAATTVGLYVHGTLLLRRIVAEVRGDAAAAGPALLGPFGHGADIAAYRRLADGGGETRPRLHRSIWLARTLLGLSVLAMLARLVLHVVS